MILLMLLATLLSSPPARASNDQCPKLRGRYFCPAVAGVHRDMLVIIDEARTKRWVTYYLAYEEKGADAFESRFVANDEGRRQDTNWSMIGKCVENKFYVSYYGDLSDDTLLHGLNSDADYVVSVPKENRILETCKRRK